MKLFLGDKVVDLPPTLLAISSEVDVAIGKVGGSLLFKRWRCKLPREVGGGEVWGHVPMKILKSRCLEMLFSTFSRHYLGLKNNQNQDCINHIQFLLQPFFSSKSQSLTFRKEWNDKSSNADSNKYVQCFSKFMLSFKKKTCSAMSVMQKPGI